MPDNSEVKTQQTTKPNQRLGFLMYRAGLAISRGYERALKPIDIAPLEAGVLSSLGYGGPNHVRGLARLLGVGRQTIVNVTRSLEGKKWIVRKTSREDARLVMFAIAAAGSRKLDALETIAQSFDEELRLIVGANNESQLVAQLLRVVEAPTLAYED
jgi:DNA-binding MarR family transcriptional regulator